jgi:hypothetical protein
MNDTVTLILHPSTLSDRSGVSSSQPVAVNAWIERGQRLDTIILPKFSWQSIHRNKPKGNRIVVPSVTFIELLDITRIITVGRIDRNRYPFAKRMHCFIVKTMNDETFFFEAKSFAERNRLVYSLKLLVARFGAKVLVDDMTMFTEFFSQAEPVPGKALHWARSDD